MSNKSSTSWFRRDEVAMPRLVSSPPPTPRQANFSSQNFLIAPLKSSTSHPRRRREGISPGSVADFLRCCSYHHNRILKMTKILSLKSNLKILRQERPINSCSKQRIRGKIQLNKWPTSIIKILICIITCDYNSIEVPSNSRKGQDRTFKLARVTEGGSPLSVPWQHSRIEQLK